MTNGYVKLWAEVLGEYADRYGDKVQGWWVDGSYRVHDNLAYDEEKLGIIARALKAGNPNGIIGMNNGVEDRVRPYTRHEDFTCGEQNVFHDRPVTRFVNGSQWHILSFLGYPAMGNPLGTGWGQPGVRYSTADLAEYIADVNECGGVVSIDVLVYRDGTLDRSQFETLKRLRPLLAAEMPRQPVPPGNLAWHKPARLLSLDGWRVLPVNGGGSGNSSGSAPSRPTVRTRRASRCPLPNWRSMNSKRPVDQLRGPVILLASPPRKSVTLPGMKRRKFMKTASAELVLAGCVSGVLQPRCAGAAEVPARRFIKTDQGRDWLARWEKRILTASRSRYCDKEMGEELGWLVSPFLNGFHHGYLATRDVKWVEMLVDWADALTPGVVRCPVRNLQ